MKDKLMSGSCRRISLNLAGQETSIEVSDNTLEKIHRPILRTLTEYAKRTGGRFVVFLAGPPGAGKTTLAALWEILSREQPGLPVQPLPLDGFHFSNDYLACTMTNSHGCIVPLKSFKGCPETYDLAAVTKRLKAIRKEKAVRWPYYDRTLHKAVDDSITVIDQGVVVVEGNYLLLDEPGWRDLRSLADFTIFIESSLSSLERVLQRLERGGMLYEEAVKHNRLVDQPNYERIMGRRISCDLTLVMTSDDFICIKKDPADDCSAASSKRAGKVFQVSPTSTTL